MSDLEHLRMMRKTHHKLEQIQEASVWPVSELMKHTGINKPVRSSTPPGGNKQTKRSQEVQKGKPLCPFVRRTPHDITQGNSIGCGRAAQTWIISAVFGPVFLQMMQRPLINSYCMPNRFTNMRCHHVI